ncbi:hypothetical protein ACWA1F_10340 [Flavobacterium sp. 3-218]
MLEHIINGFAILITKNIQDSLLYNIIKDFIYPLLLTFLSGIVAWFLFLKQIVNDKLIAKNSKEEALINKLTYFAMIIDNAIENAEGQNLKVRELINEITNEGLQNRNLQKHPTYDLNIIAEKIDKENYLLSYLSYYSQKGKKEVLTDFKIIVDSCGIINDIFIQINENLKNMYTFEREMRAEFHDCARQCADLFGKCLVNLKEIDDPLFYDLFEISKKTEILKNYQGVEIMPSQYQLFFKPTLELLDRYHSMHKEFDEDTGNLWMVTVEAVNMYNNLEYEVSRLKEMLVNQNEYVDHLIYQLKNSSKQLRYDFLNNR